MKYLIKFLLLLLGSNKCMGQQDKEIASFPIHLKKGIDFKLTAPRGYTVVVAAEGLQRPRFFAKSPDGRLFVTDMKDRSDNKEGRVMILDGWNPKTRQFEKTIPYLSGQHNPNSVAFYSKGAQHFIYVAETGKLTVYPYKPGDDKPSGTGKVIATFPDYGLSYKYGGWHLTRTLAFHNNKLYVSVGSSCNACIETEDIRATIIEMEPDGSRQRIYARGVRNAVGLQWIGNDLWATIQGRDLIGPDKPEDLLIKIQPDQFYGWPYYFQYKGKILADPAFKDSAKPAYVKKVPVGYVGFLAHSSPLGIMRLENFADPKLNNQILVGMHGSTSVWRQRGNEVVMINGPNKYIPVVTGFLQGKTEDKRYGRPCDVIQWDNKSFFISDDKNGVIYWVGKD